MPFASCARLGPDLTALGLDQPARDRQPEAGAGFARGACEVAAPEALEHSPLRLRREAVARVLDRHLQSARVGLDENGDRAVGRRVAERVRDQVEEYALHLIRRAPGDRIAGDTSLEPYPARPGLRLEPAQARRYEAGGFRLAQLERQRAGAVGDFRIS